MALFLIVAGLTGAFLPFEEELTLATRPWLSAATPPFPGAKPLDAVTLADRVGQQTGGDVGFLPLNVPADHVFILSVTAKEGAAPLPYDTVWADPYDGKIRLAFRYAELSDGAQNILPFLYQLHYSLALGPWGLFAFGVASLVWTIDCFVGFYLTLPIRKKRVANTVPGKSWWARWRPAWKIRKTARGHKLNFDLHRAGGLWLWPLLFVFAWTGVGFNLPSVYLPVMRVLGASDYVEPQGPALPPGSVPLGLATARDLGRTLLQAEADRRGFSVERGVYIYYAKDAGAYRYTASTTLDVSEDHPQTHLWLSAADGRLLRFDEPLGGSAADKTMSWLYMLHMAQVFGLPYRIFVSILGVAVAALSITGILIWMKKRSAKLVGKQRVESLAGYKRAP